MTPRANGSTPSSKKARRRSHRGSGTACPHTKGGKVVCFFRGGEKFKERYMTLGFNDVAYLDEGAMWPIAFAITELTTAEEARIAELVTRAVS